MSINKIICLCCQRAQMKAISSFSDIPNPQAVDQWSWQWTSEWGLTSIGGHSSSRLLWAVCVGGLDLCGGLVPGGLEGVILPRLLANTTCTATPPHHHRVSAPLLPAPPFPSLLVVTSLRQCIYIYVLESLFVSVWLITWALFNIINNIALSSCSQPNRYK